MELQSQVENFKYSLYTYRQIISAVWLHGYCSTASFLVINNFNNTNDRGYYWCQILANGSLLSPFPRGYVALKLEGDRSCGNGDFNYYLSPRLCAENPILTKPITAISTAMVLTSKSTQNEYNESYSLRTTDILQVVPQKFLIRG